MANNSFSEEKVLKSPFGGSWFPGTADSLKKMIYEFFSEVKSQKDYAVKALISPHAGYVYSGKVASYGYKLLIGKNIKRVFILGPSHRAYTNKIILTNYDYFQTPLGNVAVDKKVISELLKNDLFQVNDKIQYYEHSIQIQIPFLQTALNHFKIVPLVVGDLNKNQILKAAQILKKYYNPDTLFIASSDFTHYGYNYGYLPFKDNIEENLRKLDYGAYEYISKLDAKGFLSYVNKTKDTICGYIPIAIMLDILPSDTKVKVLKYDTSGNIVQDFSNSVSYFSIIFYKNKTKADDPPSVLSTQEKKDLLKLSRAVLESYIRSGKIIKPEDIGIKLSPNLKQKRGGFVTLYKNHQLRGCIGEIFPTRPLYQVVIDHTIDAAVNDPRFPALTEEELKDVKIEISALTPPKEIPSYKDIVLGRDGIYMIKNFQRAVYLPQVAPEQGWDLKTTLTHLSLKAGLDPYAWESGAKFYTFQAEVFSEE